MTRWIRRFRKLTGGVLIVGAGLLVIKTYIDWRWTRLYRPSSPRIRVESREEHTTFIRERLTMEGYSGRLIPVHTARPTGSGPFPAILFMYGAGMNIEFTSRFDLPATEAGFALFIPEQFQQGLRGENSRSRSGEAESLYLRCFLNGPELRRALDLVAARPEVDPDRIYVWGASLGAITSARAIAEDSRVQGVVFTLAGGDFRLFFESPRLADAPVWAHVAARAGFWALSSLDPIAHVGEFAPRPFLMQNALRDELIPSAAAEALHAAAKPHGEVRWYDVSHEKLPNEDLLHMIREGLEWLARIDSTSSLPLTPYETEKRSP